jgi:glycosyltransferase involved in cell wall biosynthesis
MSDIGRIAKSSAVYSYSGTGLPTLRDVSAGTAPRERLFGAFQLIARGHKITISDAQWTSRLSGLRRRLPSLLEFPSIELLVAMRTHSSVVVQGRVAPLLQLSAWILGCRFVYVDVMFSVPGRPLTRWINAIALRCANAVVGYSESQRERWIQALDLSGQKVRVGRYPMDSQFYVPHRSNSPVRSRVVAVGRDIGRDYVTLLSAASVGAFSLTLVTLEYLLPPCAKDVPGVQIRKNLPYSELFELYADATAAVIPLQKGIDYPSGIRAVLEAMLLGVPVVATRTPVLEEHFTHEQHLLYVDPEDAHAIEAAVKRLQGDPEFAEKLGHNARSEVVERFNLEQFANLMHDVLWP